MPLVVIIGTELKLFMGAGEIHGGWLRAFAILPENLFSFYSILFFQPTSVGPQVPVTPARESHALFWSPRALHVHGADIIETKYSYIKYIKVTKKDTSTHPRVAVAS